MNELSKKDQLLELIRANPFISQHDLGVQLGLSRSAVAGHIAGLIRDRRLLGRAYVLADQRAIMCIGAANLDRKLRSIGAVQMGTSNPARQHESFGGVARNIAENLARLGAPAGLITAVGDDASGAALMAQAEAVGIDTCGSLRLAGTGSGTYTAVLDQQGDMLLALADMALYDQLDPDALGRTQQQRANAALTVADLNLPLATIEALLGDAVRFDVPLIVVAVSQPKMDHLPEDLNGLRLLILNEGELETRVGYPVRSDAALASACAAVQAQGAKDLVVTRGARGVSYTTQGGIAHLDALDAAVVDVTGAGDAFAAAVSWTLYQGSDNLDFACRRGLALSAMTVACAHTVCPSLSPDSLDAIESDLPSDSQPFNALYQE